MSISKRKKEVIEWLKENAQEAGWSEPGAGILSDNTLADAFMELVEIVENYESGKPTQQPDELSDTVGAIFNELARVCSEAVPSSSLASLLPSHRLTIANAIAPLLKQESQPDERREHKTGCEIQFDAECNCKENPLAHEIKSEIAKTLAMCSGNHKAHLRSVHYQRKAEAVYDNILKYLSAPKRE